MNGSRKRGGEDIFGPIQKKPMMNTSNHHFSSVENAKATNVANNETKDSIKAKSSKNYNHASHVHAKPMNPEQTTTTSPPFHAIQPYRLINCFPIVEPWNANSRLTGECGSAIRRLQMADVTRMPVEEGVDPRLMTMTRTMRRATQTEHVGYGRPRTLQQTLARAGEEHEINRARGTTQRLPPWMEPDRAAIDNGGGRAGN